MSLFRLKSGSYHNQKLGLNIEPGGTIETDEDMRRLEGYDRWELVRTGREAETIEDLRARIALLEGRPKEEAEPEDVNPVMSEDEPQLHAMQIKELRDYAAGKGIDLEGITGKSNLINAIQAHLENA